MSSYVPPILYQTGSVVTAYSMADSVTSKFESEEAAAIRRQHEERRNHTWTVISGCVAAASIVTALLAMYIEASAVAYLAFIFPLITAPTVISQRRRLNKLPTLRQEHNDIRCEVNRMSNENTQLHHSVNVLETQCQRLLGVEDSFQSLCQAQGTSAQNLARLVDDNAKIQKEMKALQETQVLQQILTAVIRSDNSGDWSINEEEMDVLLLRLRQLEAVKQVDERQLRNAFSSSATKSLATLYAITADLLQKDTLLLGTSA